MKRVPRSTAATGQGGHCVKAIGDGKVRVNSASLDNPLVILADQALEVVAIEKQLHVCRAPRHADFLNIDPTGFSSAGYRLKTK
jgi:hypothetical protein